VRKREASQAEGKDGLEVSVALMSAPLQHAWNWALSLVALATKAASLPHAHHRGVTAALSYSTRAKVPAGLPCYVLLSARRAFYSSHTTLGVQRRLVLVLGPLQPSRVLKQESATLKAT
jgi:hypothetical protein